MEEDNEIKRSKYNSGIAKEIRRSKLWEDCNNHSRSGQYSKWNDDLDRIWCELSSDAEKQNIFANKKKLFEAFDSEIVKVGQIVDTFKSGFKTNKQDILSKRAKHYKILMDKEIFLRQLEESVGKGTDWEEDNEDDF